MSQQPITDDIEVIKGTDWTDSYTVFDGDRNPFDLKGCSVEMQIRTTQFAETAMLSLATSSGGITLETSPDYLGVLCVIRRTITHEQTADMPTGRWPYDLHIELPSGYRLCPVAGTATIQPRFTEMA